MNGFKTYHPIVNFTYFLCVISFSMIFTHPVFLAVSLVCACVYSALLDREKPAFLKLLPLLPVAALVNPAFSHEGVTILAYLPSGNPLTLESIAYGLAAASVLVSVICWFSCCGAVMTSDKFIYLFGRIIPSLSLVLSMTMRFVPKFIRQFKLAADAQRCIGRDVSEGSLFLRARRALKILSVIITWALEDAVETADSMKSRGYGLHGRTAFSVFTFDSRDAKALLYILTLAVCIIAGAAMGLTQFRYFPSMTGGGVTLPKITVWNAYFLLCIMPSAIEVWEESKWKYIISKI